MKENMIISKIGDVQMLDENHEGAGQQRRKQPHGAMYINPTDSFPI